MQQQSGILYVVATPIGNLEDLSPRAIETLKRVTLVLAEDTRSFRTLANRFGISTPSRSFHDHNEAQLATSLPELLRAGESIALVSEAGTPTISDPGFKLVRECQDQGLKVSPIPGPCAAIAALSISGFETDRFIFEGFVARKPGKRRTAFERAIASDAASIFYESPHRIVKTLTELAELAPTREVFVARELTKIYEESFRGAVSEVLVTLQQRQSIKGEFVLIVRRLEDD